MQKRHAKTTRKNTYGGMWLLSFWLRGLLVKLGDTEKDTRIRRKDTV